MYPPLNLKEVRHEYRQCDCGQLGLFQLGHDKPHAIAPFAQAENPFYLYPVCIVLVFLFPGCGGDYGGRPPQAGTRQTYPMSFAVPAVVARPVYLVCQDPLRIVPGTLFEAFHSLLQGGPLVIRVKGYPLDSSIPFRVQAQVEFGTELHWGRGLAPDYGAQPWLADAHDAVRDGMHLMIVHVLLLSVHLQYGQELRDVLPVRDKALRHELLQVSDVPAYISQLLTDRCPHFLCRMLPALRECQVCFSGLPPVAPRQRQAVVPAEAPYHPLKEFSCLVEQGDVLGIADMGRRTGRVKGQGPLVLWFLFRAPSFGGRP